MIRCNGQLSALDNTAARTRSRASCNDASGSPTMVKPGIPPMCTSMSTTVPRTPDSATLRHRARRIRTLRARARPWLGRGGADGPRGRRSASPCPAGRARPASGDPAGATERPWIGSPPPGRSQRPNPLRVLTSQTTTVAPSSAMTSISPISQRQLRATIVKPACSRCRTATRSPYDRRRPWRARPPPPASSLAAEAPSWWSSKRRCGQGNRVTRAVDNPNPSIVRQRRRRTATPSQDRPFRWRRGPSSGSPDRSWPAPRRSRP